MAVVLRMLCFIALVCSWPAATRADDWLAPQMREVFSASRDHFVRVTPGSSWGDTMGFAGAAKGPYATAEFYQRQADRSYRLTHTVKLLNPVAPVDFFVSNDGRLATIDNWHNRGYGKAVAIYTDAGVLVRAYALADLFSPAEVEAFPHSESSVGWHDGPVYLNQDQRTLYVGVAAGRDLVFTLGSGRFYYCETRNAQYACRDSNLERRWRPHGDVAPAR